MHSYMLDSMYGGFLKRGTDLATVHLKALHGIAKHKNLSLGVLFADVAGAFESVIRSVVFGAPRLSDQCIVRVFDHLGFDPLGRRRDLLALSLHELVVGLVQILDKLIHHNNTQNFN